MIYNEKLWQSINETNQGSNYLQFCRSETDCQFRIHCLLETVCYLTLSSTRPPPAPGRPLQVKFELPLSWDPKFSGIYAEISFLFHWPQSGLFVLLATKWPVCFVGHKVANAFALPLRHSVQFSLLLLLSLVQCLRNNLIASYLVPCLVFTVLECIIFLPCLNACFLFVLVFT